MSTLETVNKDTIASLATPPGRGGVGIIRVSGPDARRVMEVVLHRELEPRYARFSAFFDADNEVIDEGIALFFPGPHSFTGEDVLEFQGHGGPVIMDILLKYIFSMGTRQANPGEFSERAFLNDKMDLTQAEAIADLIDSTSEQLARSAMRSLQGVFSCKVNSLVDALTELRMYVEAAIDFPEEEIDFLSDGKIACEVEKLLSQLDDIVHQAGQGAILRDGMNIVIAGRPNAGKSSLLNALSGKESAIVTDIEGTTRDVLREHILIDGMPLHVIDTAGLRDTSDKVEKIGVERAFQEIKDADRVLVMVDSTTTSAKNPHDIWPEFIDRLPSNEKLTVIRNKIDLTDEAEKISIENGVPVICLSAKNNQGLDILKQHFKDCMGFEGAIEGTFSARRRHMDALRRAREQMINGQSQLLQGAAGELLAEDLRLAQITLGEITGVYSSDDLIGKIFSTFCVGK
ncbi:tRNA modification GTPase MnmE [invertebrate metagenome]|uniref:tRNA modification GTPase MnmE n=1 Tax=invertebrate metagenome TaxID=1711999 RepID=A0A2H9T8Z4_9ZZZZ